MGRERQKQKNEEIRRAILDTALQIGMEEGFEQLSIRKITNTLGYSSGSVYHYFQDRQEIVDTIHQEASLLMKEKIEQIYDVEKSFEYNNKAIFSMILDIVLEQPEKYNLIVLDKYSKRRESVTPWMGAMEGLIKIGIQKGELREVDASMAAFNIWSSFMGLMIMISNSTHMSVEYAKDLLENHIEIIMEGIRKK